jgi:hypothetical protein
MREREREREEEREANILELSFWLITLSNLNNNT